MRAAMTILVLVLLAQLPASASQAGPTLVARNYAFEPQRLEVEAGATVTVQVTGEGHTVTAVGGAFDTGLKQGGETATFKAPAQPGEYRFYCKLHANADDPLDAQHMTGVLVVRGANGTPPAGSTPATSTPGGGTPGSPTPTKATPATAALVALAALAAALIVARRR